MAPRRTTAVNEKTVITKEPVTSKRRATTRKPKVVDPADMPSDKDKPTTSRSKRSTRNKVEKVVIEPKIKSKKKSKKEETKRLSPGKSSTNDDYFSADEDNNERSTGDTRRTRYFSADEDTTLVEGQLVSDKKSKTRSKVKGPTKTRARDVSPTGSIASQSTYTIEQNADVEQQEMISQADAPGIQKQTANKKTLKKVQPMPPGERFKQAHAKLDAQNENIGDRFERISKRRHELNQEAPQGSVFERLSTPKASRSRKDNPGFDFGDGTQKPVLNFDALDNIITENKPAVKRAAKTILGNMPKVGVKEMSRSKIPLAQRKLKEREAEQKEKLENTLMARRNFVSPGLTVPTDNPEINRLATPKTELPLGEATRLAKAGKRFDVRPRAKRPFADTTNLNDKLYRQAVELGLLSKRDGEMCFDHAAYDDLLGNATSKKERTLLNEIRSRIKVV